VPPTFSGYGRVKRKDGPFFSGDYEAAPSNPRFRNLDFILPCEKTLDSIGIQNNGPPGSESFRAFILAASGLERKANPRVSISSSDTTACAGQQIQIVAKADSGGLSPVFNWFVNGNPVSAQDSVFTSTTLQDGDSVICTLESSLYCAVPDSAISNVFVVKLEPLLNPLAQLVALDSLVCEGDPLKLRVKTQNCGNSPVFRWYLNGGFISLGDSLFTLPSYSGGDSVSCIVKVSGNCLSSDKTSSNSVSVPVQQAIVLQADLPASMLIGEDPVSLFTMPVTGTWTGPGVSENVFFPLEAGAGPKILRAYLPGNTCSDTLSKEILVLNLETTTLMLGTGLTANKYWTVEKPGLAYSEKAAVEIYNRWGKLVKSIDDYKNDWDGSDVGPGCYFFKVTYTIPGREEKITKTGHLTYMP
jgi:gliding motility-associated-like protein